MPAQEDLKKIVGEYAAGLIGDNALIGLGSGSTVYWFIQELAVRVKQGLNVAAVATSVQSEELARAAGIQIKDINDVEQLDLCVDGADEISIHFELIKGGGGALLREKMVASLTNNFIVIADESKLVNHLGKFPLPVEVAKYGWRQVLTKIKTLGCPEAMLRWRTDEAYTTDNGNYILDCYFGDIFSPAELNLTLKQIPGVVETGLFINMAKKIIIAFPDGNVREFENYLQ